MQWLLILQQDALLWPRVCNKNEPSARAVSGKVQPLYFTAFAFQVHFTGAQTLQKAAVENKPLGSGRHWSP